MYDIMLLQGGVDDGEFHAQATRGLRSQPSYRGM